MPFPKVRRLLALMAVVFVGLAAPSGAVAQEDGVTIDPGSSAGKQYQLPTEGSREVAGGSGEASASDQSSAAAQDDGGSGSTTLLILAAVVVVLVGGGTALVLRRRA